MPFSWQAQGVVWLRGVAGMTFRGRRSTLVHVGGVDAQIFVARAGNREAASCGEGERRCDIGIGV